MNEIKNDRLKQKTLFEITALAVEKSYTSVLDCCCYVCYCRNKLLFFWILQLNDRRAKKI